MENNYGDYIFLELSEIQIFNIGKAMWDYKMLLIDGEKFKSILMENGINIVKVFYREPISSKDIKRISKEGPRVNEIMGYEYEMIKNKSKRGLLTEDRRIWEIMAKNGDERAKKVLNNIEAWMARRSSKYRPKKY